MNKLIVLEFVDKKPCLQNYETHTLMKIKRSKRALKKLRKIDCENIVLSKNTLAIMPYEHCIEEVKSVSEACALSVIEKICREVSSKYGYKLPIEDVYIYASPSKAYSYIDKLVEISRIFTIITSEPPREEAYNLYAKA